MKKNRLELKKKLILEKETLTALLANKIVGAGPVTMGNTAFTTPNDPGCLCCAPKTVEFTYCYGSPCPF